MHREPQGADGYGLDDGLGTRMVEAGSPGRPLEVLAVAPALVSHPAAEASMRARAARYSAATDRVAAVHRIERADGGVRIVADAPVGVRLSDLLADLEFGNETLSDAAVLEIARAALAAVAAVHALPGGLAHGAVNPAHAVLTGDARVVLTDGVFGAALEALQLNREQIWRQFGVALPPSATLPRFDQRSDVTAVGALVLALALRRPLRAEEYPRGVGDLVMTATEACGPYGSALRMWLQQALQLHPRAVFGTAMAAQQAFAELPEAPGSRRAGGQSVQALLRARGLAAPAPAAVAPAPLEDAETASEAPLKAQLPPPRAAGNYLRSMFRF